MWSAASWLGTYRQAQAFQSDVSALRAALSAQQWDVAADRLPGALESARALQSGTETPPWRVLEALPGVGADASAVADLAASAASLLAAAGPLTPYAKQFVDQGIRNSDGSLDLAAIAAVASLARDLASVMEVEIVRLDAIDTASLRPQIADPLTELRDQLRDSQATVASAAEVAARAPALLGADGERTWLVLLQNPAEARGTGGFPGGYATLRAQDGALSVLATGKSGDLSRQSIPTDGAPADARLMWGGYLQFWNTFNMSADFPMVAGLAAAGMAARGEPVDGVIAVDTRAVAAMLAVTGPVTVDGQSVSAETAERFFTVDSYSLYPDAGVRDALTLALVREILQAFLATSWDPAVLANALRDPVAEGRVRIWSSNPDEQEWLVTTPVGGSVPNTPGSVIAVAFNNSSGNKLDAFIATGVDYRPGRCEPAQTQQSTLAVTLRNDAPDDLPLESGNYGRVDDPTAPAGSTRLLVYIYAPVGATFTSATLAGRPVDLYLGEERNRPVWWTYVTLNRGQESVIDVHFDEPFVPDVAPSVLPQAMVIDERISVEPNTSC